jgi:class 3 adenylate cyclase/predicted ATPase
LAVKENMRCSKCGVENRAAAKFCDGCGAPMEAQCVSCGTLNRAGARFCDGCGTALSSQRPSSASSTHAPEDRVRVTSEPADAGALDGERKTVTALFADIKGSTELMEDLDPEEARAIIDPALKLMIDAVRHYDGYVVQSTGDGIFALFGAPMAHEDHPQRALYAALRLQEELKRYSAKVVVDGSSPIQGRIGINTGEVVVRSITTGAGQTEYTPIGHTTNLASRMQTAAPVGSIAVSENTRKLCEGYFVLKPLGATKVKGVAELVNVYEVTGLGPLRTRLQRSAGRGLTKFVGREREMEAMQTAAQQARAGRGQIVAAMAEAGTGKSRLLFEFKAKYQPGWMVLEAFSVSHGKASAYLPLLDLLHGYFRIAAEDDARTRREKVNGRIVTLDPTLEDTRPYLFGLLGIVEGEDPLGQMDGQVKKRRTLDAIKRILLRESMNQPLMVIFEDLHWIDDETQALLNLLADSIGTTKILLLVNYRPEYSHQWNSKTYYTQLRLDPLGKESAQEMLSALLGDNPDLGPLKRVIIEKTEGNPFFMEETVQVLLDEGALERNGVTHLTRPISELKIPPTVQGILAARIDRLPHDAKDLLQTLSVAGREFPLSLIRAALPKAEEELNRMLNELQLGEFIYEQPAVGDTEYIFKHALTQEVSYNSVLVERRKQLHERIGAAIEALYLNSIEDHLDELARHYRRSGNVPKALEYHERVGQQALQRSAYMDAMRALTAAMELLMRMPESPERDRRELGLQTALGPVLMITKGWAAPETERVYLRAQKLAENGGTAAQRFSLLVGLFGIAYVGGRFTEARDRLEQTRSSTSQQPEPEFLLELHHHDWSIALSTGELEIAQRHVEDGLVFYQEHPGSVPVTPYSAHHPAVCGHAWGAIVFWLRGYPDAARRHADRAISLAHEVGHSPSVIFALGHKANFHQIAREVTSALEAAEAAITMAEKEGVPLFEPWARVARGWALAHLGQTEQGVPQIRDGLAMASAAGTEIWRTYNLAQFAEAYGAAGRIDEGLEASAEALEVVRENGERWWEAEILRLRGELLLKRNPAGLAEAQTAFEGSIKIARKQGAKSLELRTTTSLARLLTKQGKRAEARTMLAGIYNWFTEGFDTADLKDAKAQLEELGT